MATPKWGSLPFSVLLITTIISFQSLCFAGRELTPPTTTHKYHHQQDQVKPNGFGIGGSIVAPLPPTPLPPLPPLPPQPPLPLPPLPPPPRHGYGESGNPGFSIGGGIDFGDDFDLGGGFDDGVVDFPWGSGTPLYCTPLPVEFHDSVDCGPMIRLYFDNRKSRPKYGSTSSNSHGNIVYGHTKVGAQVLANDKSFMKIKSKRETIAGEGQQGHNGRETMTTTPGSN